MWRNTFCPQQIVFSCCHIVDVRRANGVLLTICYQDFLEKKPNQFKETRTQVKQHKSSTRVFLETCSLNFSNRFIVKHQASKFYVKYFYDNLLHLIENRYNFLFISSEIWPIFTIFVNSRNSIEEKTRLSQNPQRWFSKLGTLATSCYNILSNVWVWTLVFMLIIQKKIFVNNQKKNILVEILVKTLNFSWISRN